MSESNSELPRPESIPLQTVTQTEIARVIMGTLFDLERLAVDYGADPSLGGKIDEVPSYDFTELYQKTDWVCSLRDPLFERPFVSTDKRFPIEHAPATNELTRSLDIHFTHGLAELDGKPWEGPRIGMHDCGWGQNPDDIDEEISLELFYDSLADLIGNTLLPDNPNFYPSFVRRFVYVQKEEEPQRETTKQDDLGSLSTWELIAKYLKQSEERELAYQATKAQEREDMATQEAMGLTIVSETEAQSFLALARRVMS